MLFGMCVLAFALYVMRARGLPDLEPWHREVPAADFDRRDARMDLRDYLALETRLFEALGDWVERLDRRGIAAAYERYSPDSPSNPANQPVNWNRSHLVEPTGEPRGGVLLLHGLSDSPYSTRAIAGIFQEHDFLVIALRLPGHGLVPAGMAVATWRDWRAAAEIGARAIAERIPPERPFFFVGYSTGAALAVDYSLRSLGSPALRTPDRLILLSPAIGVTPLAALARVQRRVADLPGLEKLGWTDIAAEFDPFKFNSFPVWAGEQVYGLTREVQARIGRARSAGEFARFPRVLAFQSVVDATIPAAAVITRLLANVGPNGSELVVFDVNRRAKAAGLLRLREDLIRQVLEASDTTPFSLTLVTNESEESSEMVARTRPAQGEEWSEAKLHLTWPHGVYSLSHVALPFPPDDPIYGATPSAGLPLGALELRGERGVFGLSMDQLMRLRYNPFFAYVDARIRAEIETDPPTSAQTGPRRRQSGWRPSSRQSFWAKTVLPSQASAPGSLASQAITAAGTSGGAPPKRFANSPRGSFSFMASVTTKPGSTL